MRVATISSSMLLGQASKGKEFRAGCSRWRSGSQTVQTRVCTPASYRIANPHSSPVSVRSQLVAEMQGLLTGIVGCCGWIDACAFCGLFQSGFGRIQTHTHELTPVLFTWISLHSPVGVRINTTLHFQSHSRCRGLLAYAYASRAAKTREIRAPLTTIRSPRF